jgi:tRNA(Phe) wybutosine-synthesizing methylase Tyw3
VENNLQNDPKRYGEIFEKDATGQTILKKLKNGDMQGFQSLFKAFSAEQGTPISASETRMASIIVEVVGTFISHLNIEKTISNQQVLEVTRINGLKETFGILSKK